LARVADEFAFGYADPVTGLEHIVEVLYWTAEPSARLCGEVGAGALVGRGERSVAFVG
jgi:hypothetical protein